MFAIGSKSWGAFLIFAIVLNVASIIINGLSGNWLWVGTGVLCLIMLAWCVGVHNEAKESRR